MDKQADQTLAGAEAVDWFGRYGWRVIRHTDEFRVVCRSYTVGDFMLGRIWHTPVHLSTIEGREPSVLLTSVLCIVGGYEYRSRGQRFAFGPGDLATIIEAEPAELIARQQTATVFVGTDPDRLPTGARASSTPAEIFTPSSPARGVLSSVVVSSLNDQVTAGAPEWQTFRRGIEFLLAAALDSDRSRVSDGRAVGASAPLLDRARALVAARATDPDFDVESLRSALGVSSTHLHRLFAEAGTTPGRHLRRTRASIAAAYVGDVDWSGMDLAEYARAAGFRTARSMKEALKRFESEEESSGVESDIVRFAGEEKEME